MNKKVLSFHLKKQREKEKKKWVTGGGGGTLAAQRTAPPKKTSRGPFVPAQNFRYIIMDAARHESREREPAVEIESKVARFKSYYYLPSPSPSRPRKLS